MPMAPSAAAKDSCPARKQKHFVSSRSSIAPRLPWPRPTLRLSATEPGMQKACRPIADGFGRFGRVGHALLERDGRAEGVGPGRVVERDGLNALDDRVYVDALGIAERLAVVERGETVFVEAGFDLLAFFFRILQTLPL